MCKTWKKETDDLFDFEANDIIETDLKIKDFNSKFYLIYNNEHISLINSYPSLLEKYHDNLSKTKENKDNNFLIISEFYFSPITSSFKIYNPILSVNLRQKIDDISCLSRTWRLSKKMKKI